MRILLFVTSVYNTLENINGDEFMKIINKLDEIAEEENDQVIMISFCDDTENREIYLYFLRNLLNNLRFKNIILGHQFLGNIYYKDIIGGGALIYDSKFSKEKEVFKYVDKLEKRDNYINLYYVDGNGNIDKINKIFSNFNSNIESNIIINSNQEIINELDNILSRKKALRKNLDI